MITMLEQRLLTLKTHPVLSRYFSEAEPADRMPPDVLARFQADSLRAIVRRAYDGSPFYRGKMERGGITPGDIEGPADLSKLPFLTKDELRGNPWLLLACDKEDVALIQVSTGTTGGEEIYMASTWSDYILCDLAPRYSSLFPIRPGDVCLNALPYEMSTAGLAFHKTFMEGYQAAVIPAGKGGAYSTAPKTMKVIEDLRPSIIITSPSWAITLAEEAARRSLDLTELLIKKIWLTGEGCSPAFRRRVEKLWGAPANFFYGSLECGVLGIECDAHNGYHVPEAHVLMEVVDPRTGERLGAGGAGPADRPGPGPIGEIVVTALLRYDTPVLRFRTGDLGCIDSTPCACGAQLRRFHMKGRAFDQIQIHGKSVSPIYLEELLMRMPEVGNWFQFVVPAEAGARLKVRCELAVGVRRASGLADRLALGMESATDLPFEFEIVERMPRPSGKAVRVVRE